MSKPLILITNDDGITSEGIHRLADAVSELGEVVVVAPDGPRSGGSASITCTSILRPKRKEDYRGAQMWELNGTPVDCVKLGLEAILSRKPDLILSGINHGANTGDCVVYSGTMGAALEGCMQHIPSIGFSIVNHHPTAEAFDACMPVVRRLSAAVLEKGLPDGVCLNVNMPGGGQQIRGAKRARACKGRWSEEFASYTDPFGSKFYMLTGEYINEEPEAEDTDLYWIAKGYASVVPTVPDRDYTGVLPFEI